MDRLVSINEVPNATIMRLGVNHYYVTYDPPNYPSRDTFDLNRHKLGSEFIRVYSNDLYTSLRAIDFSKNKRCIYRKEIKRVGQSYCENMRLLCGNVIIKTIVSNGSYVLIKEDWHTRIDGKLATDWDYRSMKLFCVNLPKFQKSDHLTALKELLETSRQLVAHTSPPNGERLLRFSKPFLDILHPIRPPSPQTMSAFDQWASMAAIQAAKVPKKPSKPKHEPRGRGDIAASAASGATDTIRHH